MNRQELENCMICSMDMSENVDLRGFIVEVLEENPDEAKDVLRAIEHWVKTAPTRDARRLFAELVHRLNRFKA